MKTRPMVQLALLTSVALVLSYFERMIPLTTALPGVKLGMANTVLLYAIILLAPRHAFSLMGLKVLMSGFLYAGFSAVLFSLAGGLLSLMAMLAAKKVPGVSMIGISVAGAVAHNVGQILVAMIIVQTRGLILYLPILLISGVAMGVFTGLIARLVIRGVSFHCQGNGYSKDIPVKSASEME